MGMNNQRSLTEQIQAVISKYEEERALERKEFEDQIASLRSEIKSLRERDFHTIPLERFVADPQLKERLSRLGDSPPLDTVIREAGVVLENRIKLMGESQGSFGVRMVENLMDPENGNLIFSDQPNEQKGVMRLYMGALQFIRNPPMHNLIEYPEQTARILIKLVDALLQLLDDANPNSRKKEISNRNKSYLAFFDELSMEYWSKFHSRKKPKSQPQNWYAFGGGKSGIYFGWSFRAEGRFSAEVYIDSSTDPGKNIRYLEQLKSKFPSSLVGLENLQWKELPGKRACRIVVFRPGEIASIMSDLELKADVIRWGIEKMQLLEKAFRDPIKGLKS